MEENDQASDQDIDTAGTEADRTYPERHPPEGDEGPRGSDPRTLHRAEDDDVAYGRSPEFHDQPGSGGARRGPPATAGDAPPVDKGGERMP